MSGNSTQYELAEPPSDVISSLSFAQSPSTKLLVSSWDKHVYVYDINPDQNSWTLARRISHRAPVLSVCFGADPNEAFSAGLDWDINRLDLRDGSRTVLSTHSKPACAIAYDPTTRLLVSASWDGTLHLHSPDSPSSVPATLTLPAKPFSLSMSATKLTVCMSTRQVHIYDLSSLATLSRQAAQAPPNPISVEPFQRRESALKFMTRDVASMADDAGYACASIEGRVAVEWFDPSDDSQKRKYAYKCHRDKGPGPDEETVFPVHALAWHPVHGTLATGGGEGIVAIWDVLGKRRIRQYHRFPASVAALSFTGDGRYLAIAVSPGFEDGNDSENLPEGPVKVFVRELGEDEAKPKEQSK